MKILRTSVLVLFLVVTVLFGLFKYQQISADKTYPVIHIEEDMLNVSVNATKEDLLVGVTAYDEKDGDLTDEVIVESISHFTELGVCVVEYAVCDEDNHTASAVRKITYTDYESPRFTLNGSLVFRTSSAINIRRLLGATCVLDGDIGNKVIITSEEYSMNVAGIYKILAKVTNSKGDTIELELPVYVEDISLSAPKIILVDYMTYLTVGDDFDPMDNVRSCLDYDENDLTSTIVIDTNLDLTSPGMYEIHYRVSDAAGRAAHEIATVIVEE